MAPGSSPTARVRQRGAPAAGHHGLARPNARTTTTRHGPDTAPGAPGACRKPPEAAETRTSALPAPVALHKHPLGEHFKASCSEAAEITVADYFFPTFW